jgi:hypothetical protein
VLKGEIKASATKIFKKELREICIVCVLKGEIKASATKIFKKELQEMATRTKLETGFAVAQNSQTFLQKKHF